MKSATRANGVAIIVPAFNEAASIQRVVTDFQTLATVIVVDDGSADSTAALARDAGGIVVTQPVNLGYTRALAAGLQSCIEGGYSQAVTADADGQHATEHVATAIDLLNEGADAVVGIRDSHQRISETIFSLVGSARWSIKDPLCGLKGYRLDRLREFSSLCTYESIGTELIIRMSLRRRRIAQFPVRVLPRIGVSVFGRGLKTEMRILAALGRGLQLS